MALPRHAATTTNDSNDPNDGTTRAPAQAMAARVLSHPNIEILWNTAVAEFVSDADERASFAVDAAARAYAALAASEAEPANDEIGRAGV